MVFRMSELRSHPQFRAGGTAALKRQTELLTAALTEFGVVQMRVTREAGLTLAERIMAR